MIELDGKFGEILKELRETISQIKGVSSINETVSLSYIVEVSDESHKQNVETVGGLLSSQAEQFGFSLEIIPFTKEEIAKAEEEVRKHFSEIDKHKVFN